MLGLMAIPNILKSLFNGYLHRDSFNSQYSHKSRIFYKNQNFYFLLLNFSWLWPLKQRKRVLKPKQTSTLHFHIVERVHSALTYSPGARYFGTECPNGCLAVRQCCDVSTTAVSPKLQLERHHSHRQLQQTKNVSFAVYILAIYLANSIY